MERSVFFAAVVQAELKGQLGLLDLRSGSKGAVLIELRAGNITASLLDQARFLNCALDAYPEAAVP